MLFDMSDKIKEGVVGPHLKILNNCLFGFVILSLRFLFRMGIVD
ncbi:MAG: hypothetical protein JETT_1640 [Candidatus Jettenia ecosi]|uniref:Uncharacterized protein n=1 Tax=Candidatus Jettenia ecosi TaxID=2494326 RepID=A0A533QBM4_9BACT|nr:MAG: hypothetical protein JETT_1640 [Candidatus Jettenia ecosi]